MNENETTAEETAEEIEETPQDSPPESPPETAGDDSPAPVFSEADPLKEIGRGILESAPEKVPDFVEKMQAEASQESAVDNAEKIGKGEAPRLELIRDKQGYYFDPDLHRIGPNGKPLFTKTGLFEMKHGKRRKEGRKRLPKNEEVAAAASESMADKQAAALREAEALRMEAEAKAAIAAKTCDSLYWAAMMLGFPEIGAPKQGESQAGQAALKDYFLTLERPVNMPPWMPPLLLYGRMTATRFQHEKAAPVRRKLREKAALLWYRITRRKPKRADQAETEKTADE